MRVNDAIVVGASGELSDFQYLQQLLEEITTEDFCMDDGHRLSPRECFAYLSRVLYNRRNKYASDFDWYRVIVTSALCVFSRIWCCMLSIILL